MRCFVRRYINAVLLLLLFIIIILLEFRLVLLDRITCQCNVGVIQCNATFFSWPYVGQASSANAKAAGLLAEEMAKQAWSFAEGGGPAPPASRGGGGGASSGKQSPLQRQYSSWTHQPGSRRQYSTHAKQGEIQGHLVILKVCYSEGSLF